MTLAELTTLFQEQLKNFSSNIYSPTLVKNLLDEAQIDIVRATDCYIGELNSTFTSGSRIFDIGTDVIKIQTMQVDNGSSVWTIVEPTTEQQLYEHTDYPAETSAIPQYYFLRLNQSGGNTRVHLSPTPNANSSVYVGYTKKPPSLVSDNQPVIPSTYHRMIAKKALYEALWKDVKTEVADRWKREYEEELMKMKAEIKNLAGSRTWRMQPYRKDHRARWSFARND